MSDDLIKRSDAIKVVWGEDINPSEDGVVFEAQSHIDRDIRLIPSEDRPQGYWTKTDAATYRCSECGKKQIADDENELNYCCCCGSHNKIRNIIKLKKRGKKGSK